MNVYSIIAIALIGALISLFITQYKPEYAIFVSIITTVVIFIYAITTITPIITKIKDIANLSNISFKYISVLIKSIGICYITQFAYDTCIDAKQTSIANKIELIGRISICVISIPIYSDVLDIIKNILEKI